MALEDRFPASLEVQRALDWESDKGTLDAKEETEAGGSCCFCLSHCSSSHQLSAFQPGRCQLSQDVQLNTFDCFVFRIPVKTTANTMHCIAMQTIEFKLRDCNQCLEKRRK